MKSTLKHMMIVLIITASGCLNAQENTGQSRGMSEESSNQSDMLEKALSSVVTVGVYKTSYMKTQLGMRGGNTEVSDETYKQALDMAGVRSSGSGFVIERGGEKYVITNAHVIENASDEPESVYVFTYDRNRYEVEVLGGDSFYDFAILRFREQPGNDVVPVDYKQDRPRIGEKVFAIGNPLGEYPYTVTDGIVSALNRARGGVTGKFGFLQTTATVIWGNSGGPLVDVNGDVAGINSQIAFASAPDGSALWQSQINFALEAEIAEKLTDDILENDGRVIRSYFGLEIGESYGFYSTPEGAMPYKMDQYPVIRGAVPGAPSFITIRDNIGAQVVKVNNAETRNLDEVLGELEKTKPNQTISLTLISNGATRNIEIKSTLLATGQLENIGKYIIDRDPNIVANTNLPGVVLTPGSNNQYQKYGYEEKKYQTTKVASNNNFMVLAGGVYDEGGSNVWKVESYSDLGAVLKLSGLLGVFDFFVLPEGGSEEDIELYRHNLSGSEDVIQRTLWY